MTGRIRCVETACTECEGIVARTYRELREAGYPDRDAFVAAVRVLELRHPGHDRQYYFLRIAQWLGSDAGA